MGSWTGRLIFLLSLMCVDVGLLLAEDGFAQETVRNIIVLGNVVTPEKIILRELQTRPGDPVEILTLMGDESLLLDLQIFSYVEILQQPSENDSVNILVYVEERSRWIPFPLAYASQIDGWSFGGGLEYRNILSRNSKLGIYGVVGVSDNFFLRYSDPWIFGDRISLMVELSRVERDNRYENYHQIQNTGSVEFGKKLGIYFQYGIKAGIRLEQADVTGITLTDTYYDQIPFLQFSALYDKRDIFANPSSGWRLSSIIGQFGIPGNSIDYRMLQLIVSNYFPLHWAGRTLAVGWQYSVRNGTMGCYDQFYLGGTETVRGLPVDFDRGSRMLLGMIEYRVDILKSNHVMDDFDLGLGGTLFLDTGATWNHGDSPFDQIFSTSYGIGLRMLIPVIEVIRMDYGWTLDGESAFQIAALAKF